MILLIFVAILATASNVMLVQCKQLLARRGIVSYADIGVYSFGMYVALTTIAPAPA